MLSYQGYTKAIDVWSAGCILAEFLGGKPIFKGKDYVNQLNQILQVLGTPPDETLRRIGSKNVQDYIHQLGFIPKVPFVNLYPNANSQALDLLEQMLAFDPQKRITVDEALEHPYLSIWHDPADEPVCSEKFEFSFESVNDMEDLKQMVIQEVQDFRLFVRQPLLGEQRQLQLQQQQQQQQQQPSDVDNGNAAASEENYPKQMATSNSVAPQQESFGIHSQNLPRHDADFPPRPQESMMEMRPATGNTADIPPQNDNGTLLDLEKELEFGLDRKYF
ncbi:ANM_HP_G0005390.mRNA.1.CDS.1 [Saccharomyces cerevisiae]|nr:ANM_HP_G0005390.mRNA.1.CDS.1 [Saccharomyces cerevisiae]CAI7032514.1 ANM_HP_G0005390.mRNA.1.CDS.1 [Saccharomyces cerevisiae]